MSKEAVIAVTHLIDLGMIAQEDIVKCLTKAIAEPEPAQKPVAWAVELPDGTRKPLYTAEFTCSTGLCHYKKPLTDEEIEKCYETTGHYQELRPQDRFAVFALARAIEAAHGIKEKT